MNKNKNYCIVFSTKNQYRTFEELLFAKSAARFQDVLLINVDADSNERQLKMAEEVCSRNDIHWINKNNPKSGIAMQNCIKLADDWLIKNKVNVDWILHFHDDCYPTSTNFWEELDKYLEKYNNFNGEVGMFGFNVGGNKLGRGCLQEEILEPPHSGWYSQHMPKEYYTTDYFVAEVPFWCGVGINRNLFRKHIKVDNGYKLNLWGDDVAHQFMYKGIYNIVFPKLNVIHDIDGKKKLGEQESFQYHNLYSKDEEHKTFRDKWKFTWGYRNTNLRNEFNSAFSFYDGTIQEKLFSTKISSGPKTIDYYKNMSLNFNI